MFVTQKILKTPNEYKQLIPLLPQLAKEKQLLDQQLKENFWSKKKYVVVVGPCSADGCEAMDEYLCKLKTIAQSCPDLFVVARIYTTKPHSNGTGYKGTCFCLHDGEEEDLHQGIIRARKMMLSCLQMGIAVADELLYTDLYPYFDDLVSYWFLGARSSEDTLHRSFASGLDVCCGVKNGTDGDIRKLINSLFAVQNASVFPCGGRQIATNGCKHSHVVLRGGVDANGFVSNITTQSINLCHQLLQKNDLPSFILADLSHSNSSKVASRQISNAQDIASNPLVNGVMLESYLKSGVSANTFGMSQTDDCLSICDTEMVLKLLQSAFANRK